MASIACLGAGLPRKCPQESFGAPCGSRAPPTSMFEGSVPGAELSMAWRVAIAHNVRAVCSALAWIAMCQVERLSGIEAPQRTRKPRTVFEFTSSRTNWSSYPHLANEGAIIRTWLHTFVSVLIWAPHFDVLLEEPVHANPHSSCYL